MPSEVFVGNDLADGGTVKNPKYQLYITNGQPGSGTKPLIATPGSSGTPPSYVTRSGRFIYVELTSPSGASEIWATDGTTITQLDPSQNGGSYTVSGFYPGPTAFTTASGVNEIAFIGNNLAAGGTTAAPKYQLYVSNGTAGGTKVIDPSFTTVPYMQEVSGNLVYFSASDQFGGTELWVTDGTSVSELDPNPSRTTNTYLSPGYPVAFTTLGGVQEVAFTANSGTSTTPKYQLYISNGTAGGTKPVSPAFVSSPYYFVVSDSRVYFEASTAAGTEIWATDGSTVTEIDPSTNGGSYTLDGIYPYLLGFTTASLVQEVAFVGNNLAAGGTTASPKYQIYVSNGQAGGTHAVGPTFNSQPVLEQVNGGLLYFEATDSRGGVEYWATDGTNVTELDPGPASAPVSDSYAADSMAQIPTYAIAASDAAKPDGRTGLTPYTFTITRSDDTASRRYLNYQASVSGGSLSTSQVFSNASGQIVFQLGVSVTTLTLYANPLPFYAGQAFTVTLSGALDPVGMVSTSSSSIAVATATGTLQKNAVNVTPSLVLQNTSGAVYGAVLNGFAETATSTIGPPSAAWHVLATGDLNGDGNADFILQNDNGQIYAWLMNGARLAGSGALPSVTSDWHVKVMGDLNGDGEGDIVLQDDNGAVQVWEMSGTTIVASAPIANPGAAWHVVGAADLNGDGKADVILQNDNGQVYAWLMNGTTTIGGGVIGNLGADWHVVGAGDLNGDGRSDIVLQNTSGAVYAWEMNGTAIAAQGTIGNPGAAWHVVGTEDVNGDGRADVVLQNASGQVYAWEMNGTTMVGWGSVANAAANLHVVGERTMQFISSADGANLTATSLPDTFTFFSYTAAMSTISGFNPAQDIVELNQAHFATYGAVQAATTADGTGSAVIHLDSTHSLTLTGIAPASLSAANFQFA